MCASDGRAIRCEGGMVSRWKFVRVGENEFMVPAWSIGRGGAEITLTGIFVLFLVVSR